jgi:hypothetical protein
MAVGEAAPEAWATARLTIDSCSACVNVRGRMREGRDRYCNVNKRNELHRAECCTHPYSLCCKPVQMSRTSGEACGTQRDLAGMPCADVKSSYSILYGNMLRAVAPFPEKKRAMCFFARNGFHKVSTACWTVENSANPSGKTHLAAKTKKFRTVTSELLRSK